MDDPGFDEGQALRLAGAGDDSELEATIENGIGHLSIDYKKPYGGDAGFTVEVDGDEVGAAWTDEDDIQTLLIEDINVEGEFTLTITATDAQTQLDNISWTEYVGSTTQAFDDFREESGYDDGSFIGVDGLEWYYFDTMQDGNQAR